MQAQNASLYEAPPSSNVSDPMFNSASANMEAHTVRTPNKMTIEAVEADSSRATEWRNKMNQDRAARVRSPYELSNEQMEAVGDSRGSERAAPLPATAAGEFWTALVETQCCGGTRAPFQGRASGDHSQEHLGRRQVRRHDIGQGGPVHGGK